MEYCGFVYQLYDFVVIDASLRDGTSALQVRTPSCVHHCSFCSSSPRWTSCSSFQMNASVCLHCQLFACEECGSSTSLSATPIPSILSMLPPAHILFLQPLSVIPSAICVITFSSPLPHAIHPVHPLLLALFASATCPRCQEHPLLTVFIYAEKELSESEPFLEFQRHLPAERIVVIPIVQETAPLLR